MIRSGFMAVVLLLHCGSSDQEQRCHEACYSVANCEQGPHGHHGPRDFDDCLDDCIERELSEMKTQCMSTKVGCDDVFACAEAPL